MAAEKVFKVKGMHCKSCEMLVTEALEDIGVKADASEKDGTVRIVSGLEEAGEEKIRKAIEAEGYRVE